MADTRTAIKVEIPATNRTGRGKLEPDPEPLPSSGDMSAIPAVFNQLSNEAGTWIYESRKFEAAGCRMQRGDS